MSRSTARFRALVIGMLLGGPLSFAAGTAALADGFMETPVTVVPVPSAPITITKCKLGQYQWQQFTNITNRTMHSLLVVTFRFNYFDTDGTQIGTVDSTLSLDPPLTSGDDQMLSSTASPTLSEPSNAIARMTCRIQGAAFTGLKKWTFGQRWPERLSNVPREQAVGNGGSSPVVPSASDRRPKAESGLTLIVSNTWNDVVSGNLLVHAALDVRGGDTEMALRPQMLTLSMALSNGQNKTYRALSQGAPTYQKINPLANTPQTAFEVDPKDDLGRLGSVIVPAHGAVRVTATFFVGPDAVADPSNNRRVAIR